MSDVSSAAQLAADHSSLLVVKAGTLVDGTGAAARRGVQIYVRDGRIADVTASGDVPSEALVLDFPEQAVVPGLEVLGLGAELGTIQPGRQADLTVVDGDPSVDISVLKRPRAVIQGGRVVAEHGRLLA